MQIRDEVLLPQAPGPLLDKPLESAGQRPDFLGLFLIGWSAWTLPPWVLRHPSCP